MNYKINKIEAVVLTAFLLAATFLVPVSALKIEQNKNTKVAVAQTSEPSSQDVTTDLGPFWLDKTYIMERPLPATALGDNDDAGYKKDAGNELSRSLQIYPGEMVDDWPGRGTTGKLTSSDTQDWYFFSVCQGQNIVITMTPPSGYNYDLGLFDKDANEDAASTNSGSTPESITLTADYTGFWYMKIYRIDGEGQYSFTVTLVGQNDANTGNDAGDDFAGATILSTTGDYFGYVDMNDEEDWYKFNVNAGQGIHLTLEMKTLSGLSDFDIYLYNPSGTMVYRETGYYDDDLLYPADVSGYWRAKVKIFPGYTDIPQPTEWQYWTYGSGAYKLKFNLEASATAPPGPIPQPQITPIAQTFKIANDPDSTKDDFGYLASIPACNYLEDEMRHLAPIVYTGDTTPTNWFGTVEDTTNYLLDDWNTYLASMDKTPVEYNVPTDPIQAAAQIATDNWASSDTAVVAIDGSVYEDTTTEVLHRTKTLPRNTEVITVPNNSDKLMQISGSYVYPMFIGPKWGAINVSIYGSNIPATVLPSLIELFPKFVSLANDWWPVNGNVPRYDIYYPLTTAGVWAAATGVITGNWEFKITKYECDRYRIRVTDADSVLKATVTTTTPSDLMVMLVDPQGHIRAPDYPDWNGGEINPIHGWNGMDTNDPAVPTGPYRDWNPDPHTTFSAEVLHPEKGTWTAIVVPRNAQGSSSIKYTISGEIRKLNQKRVDATISATNAAVIASQEHVPLLYVTENEVPAATQSAFTALGVNKVIFVERNDIGGGVKASLPTLDADLKTMQEIIDYIKAYPTSENYITITSLKSGDGYFAPSAMLAAYHGSPVLRIEEASSEVSGESAVSTGAIIVGQINDNVYCLDTKTGEYIWSNPVGWTPKNPSPLPQPKGQIYLGSTDDTIYCLDSSSGDILWTYPTNYVQVSPLDNVKGSLYLDVNKKEAYCQNSLNGVKVEALPLGKATNPAGMANRIDSWELWGGDYYHGTRAPGHLPIADAPLAPMGPGKLLIEILKYVLSNGAQGELPPLGMDAKRYWNEEMYNGVHDWIKGLGLDLDGQEGYVFVAPRKDIRLQMHSVMMGNNSYAGDIPGETPAFTSDIIVRDIIYPALIFANPNRDVTTTQFMNYPDGDTWKTNDGVTHQVYSSRLIKESFMSHNRIYDSHCLWEAHLERINEGASVMYYSGHGTGGSGISGQYIQTDYSNYPDQIWYDAWRGYMYDNWKTPRDNGRRWYNPEPPNLYDIIHYKWIDQLMGNLKSNAVFYMSCSTAQQFAPLVYLEHGATVWYGNAGSGLCPEADLQDDEFFKDALTYGEPIGPAFSKQVWLHYRDFTTSDPTSMYGPSSLYGGEGVTTIQCIYGDPNLIIYSPDWTSPVPVDSPLRTRNNPPSTPTITGPTNGNAGVEYQYNFTSTDPEGDNVTYGISWGEGCPGIVWVGPYPSGQEITVSHTYSGQGTFTISAMAKDIYDAESDWGTLEVTMPTIQQSAQSQTLLIKLSKYLADI
ncbi:MAG: PQQ-binding-like beta-propeller repeat protein [Euryarchaeota archaeon]|nr:PQQ-binding-like beta-propeller repeat protein [Euryarchaeota archaeon]